MVSCLRCDPVPHARHKREGKSGRAKRPCAILATSPRPHSHKHTIGSLARQQPATPRACHPSGLYPTSPETTRPRHLLEGILHPSAFPWGELVKPSPPRGGRQPSTSGCHAGADFPSGGTGTRRSIFRPRAPLSHTTAWPVDRVPIQSPSGPGVFVGASILSRPHGCQRTREPMDTKVVKSKFYSSCPHVMIMGCELR